jgi:hypothetical protein
MWSTGGNTMFKLTGIKISLLKDFGEISEKKIEKLTDSLIEHYPDIVNISVGRVFVNKETKEHVIVAPGQIIISQEGLGITPNLKKFNETALKIFDALLLNNETDVIYKFTGVFPSNGSALESSLGLLASKKQAQIDEVPEIKGLGLRFIYGFGDQMGDLRIEPFIRDDSYYFVELEYNNQSIPLEKVINNASELCSDFTGRLSGFAMNIAK